MKTLVAAFVALACFPAMAHAQTPLSVRGLVRQADFVGIIQAEPPPSAAQGEWRQNVFVFLPGAEAIKGDHAGATGYPTRFGEQGEYLVFLYRTGAGATMSWTMLAAYRVRYYPNEFGGMFSIRAGSTVGLLASRPAVTITQARMALAQKLAGAITPNTTRADVEKIFPQSDGGLVSSERGRYYFGSEIMVDVPYDANGGPFQPENRVNGPLRVYHDSMHSD